MAERTRKTDNKKSEEKKATFSLKDVAEWSIRRAHQFDNGNISFDLQLGAITLYRLIVVKAKDDHEFISFPQYQSNGKWYNYYYIPFTDKDQDAIIDAVYDSIDD